MATIRSSITDAVNRSGRFSNHGVQQLFEKLAQGEVVEDPFPKVMAESFVNYFYQLFDGA